MQLGAGFRRVLILPLTALVGGRNVAARLLPEEDVFDGDRLGLQRELQLRNRSDVAALDCFVLERSRNMAGVSSPFRALQVPWSAYGTVVATKACGNMVYTWP